MKFVKFEKTDRGFTLGSFVDRYEAFCTIQKSSLADEDCIWLGVHDAEPKILARDAVSLGREDLLPPPGTPERFNGWVEYPLPEEVHISTRMHLNRDMVRALLPILTHFAETGDLPTKAEA